MVSHHLDTIMALAAAARWATVSVDVASPVSRNKQTNERPEGLTGPGTHTRTGDAHGHGTRTHGRTGASEGTRTRTPHSPKAPTRRRHRLRRTPSHIQLQRPVHHLSVGHHTRKDDMCCMK